MIKLNKLQTHIASMVTSFLADPNKTYSYSNKNDAIFSGTLVKNMIICYENETLAKIYHKDEQEKYRPVPENPRHTVCISIPDYAHTLATVTRLNAISYVFNGEKLFSLVKGKICYLEKGKLRPICQHNNNFIFYSEPEILEQTA